MFGFGKKTFGVAALLGGMIWSGLAAADELTWWAPNWGQERAQNLITKFEAANPGITVKLEITVADGLQNRVLAALHTNSPPDLIDINNAWTTAFAATGAVLQLDDLVASSHTDLSDFFTPSLDISKLGGKLYGLPYRMDTHVFFYDKGLYQAAGLDPNHPPESWSQLLDYSKKLTRVDAGGKQIYGYGVDGGGEVANLISRLMPMIWANGGTIVSDDGKKVLIDQPAAVEAVKFYTDLFTSEGVSPPSTLQNDGLALRRLFSAGTLAAYQSGMYDIPVIHQENPNLQIGMGLLPHPDGKQTASVLTGWNFIIPKASKHIDSTWKFVQFLIQPDNMGYYTDTFPAKKSALNLPRFQNPEMQASRDMLPFARPAPTTPAFVQISQIVYDRVQSVLLKKASAQDAMTAAAKQIQPLLDKAQTQ